jgi:hypothetical protein
MPEEYAFSLLTEKALAASDSATHTGIKPYIPFFSKKYEHVADSHRVYKYIHEDPGVETVFYKHLIRIEPKDADFKLRLDPLLNLELGRDLTGKQTSRLYTNTRGFVVSGNAGQKVYFESLFAENQSLFPTYLETIAQTSSVIPGQGRWKSFKTGGYDYAFSSAFVSIQASKNFNIQVGHGKQKIGNGYRSLLLSDNAFNYPYARFTEQWLKGRIQYTAIYAVLMNFYPAAVKAPTSTERLLQKKAASFQYLSVNASKQIDLGFFQGMIWQAGDGRNVQQIDWQYINPLIYTNLLSYGLNNKNNIIAGGDFKIKLGRGLSVYGQFMADDLSNTDSLGNGWGYQGGAKYFDAFGVKNLFLQTEFNYVSPASYRNVPGAPADQSYNHYSQPLAFTQGRGQELILLADYKYHRWDFNVKYNYQDVPLYRRTAYFNNIVNARISYLINPAYNLNITAGYTYRNQNFSIFRTLNNETSYFFIGLRTSLYNFYYDF